MLNFEYKSFWLSANQKAAWPRDQFLDYIVLFEVNCGVDSYPYWPPSMLDFEYTCFWLSANQKAAWSRDPFFVAIFGFSAQNYPRWIYILVDFGRCVMPIFLIHGLLMTHHEVEISRKVTILGMFFKRLLLMLPDIYFTKFFLIWCRIDHVICCYDLQPHGGTITWSNRYFSPQTPPKFSVLSDYFFLRRRNCGADTSTFVRIDIAVILVYTCWGFYPETAEI